MLTFIESIERSLKLYPLRHYFHWRMPRQTGVTTGLISLANKLSRDQKVVMFVHPNKPMLGYAIKNLVTYDSQMHVAIDNLDDCFRRGMSRPDVIIIDTCKLSDFQLSALQMGVWADKAIHVDTTEG